MSDELKYMLKIGVDDDVDVGEVEDTLKERLAELHAVKSVSEIKVIRDGYVTTDQEMLEMLAIMDDLESDEIMKAINFVQELENIDDE